MQFTITSAVLALMAATRVAAGTIQLNYYGDAECYDYENQLDVTWGTALYGKNNANCYTFNYGQAARVVSCPTGGCTCYFYQNKDCTGARLQADFGNGGSTNCMGGIQQSNSLACYYY